jgi:histidinol dehydrogenase
MIPILEYQTESGRARVEALLKGLGLDPVEIALSRGRLAEATEAVRKIMADVAERGDAAVVDANRRFDDPQFTADQIRIRPEEMRAAAGRVPGEQLDAIRRSIGQVREYQSWIMPKSPEVLRRPGVELGLRFTALDSAGLYVPGGHAAYPSSLIMLAAPAQVAGVKRVVACTPPSKYGRSDLFLAAAHELGLSEVYRAGGAAIAAMAFGTETIPKVDKIVGPGNTYIQLAKRLLAGVVGVDGYLGPSEIVVIADETGRSEFIAADLIAQAEHDPGSAFLLTTSAELAKAVVVEVKKQMEERQRRGAIESGLRDHSAIVVDPSMERLTELANRFAAEHVNLQVRDEASVLSRLSHAGAVFVGQYAPVAAGDYVAGPSHCLPTNRTARFSSGISVYEFLKRSSVVRYNQAGLANDAKAIMILAEAEHLDAHAASVRIRGK